MALLFLRPQEDLDLRLTAPSQSSIDQSQNGELSPAEKNFDAVWKAALDDCRPNRAPVVLPLIEPGDVPGESQYHVDGRDLDPRWRRSRHLRLCHREVDVDGRLEDFAEDLRHVQLNAEPGSGDQREGVRSHRRPRHGIWATSGTEIMS